ncbi:hypothetical protein JY96_11130 [Aquabacterium sp. NJ1]|uniref:PEP-CTERM sorting domain-containing protein n=1 Tax=Aquabacterium sp. NJ1 TaxID=1538295 RepID=UPI00052C9994|nr:PEP-CTERM sorting domain-containing protein [Aquabacterium sp. NJ1]KGM40396.1 hypothetical protein JY96_11130 [Aquabacterium sp. NJ1]
MKKIAVSAICLFVGSYAAAADPTVSSSSAKISNLSYSLIDENVSDGIKASVSFLPSDNAFLVSDSDIYSPVNVKVTDLTGGFLGSKNDGVVNVPINDMVLKKANTSASVDASYKASRITNAFTSLSPEQLNSAITTSYFTRADSPGEMVFNLAPHTTIVFKGNVDVNATMDASSMKSALQPLLGSTGKLEMFSAASVDVRASIPPGMVGGQYYNGSYAEYENYIFAFQTMTASSLSAVSFMKADTDPHAFSIYATNNTDVFQEGRLEINLEGSHNFLLNPQLATPEPGTYAMFGLGLLGVIGAKRRQRRKLATALAA